MRTIKEVAEEICRKPKWDGNTPPGEHERGDWLNRVTRVESILEKFKAEIEAEMQCPNISS